MLDSKMMIRFSMVFLILFSVSCGQKKGDRISRGEEVEVEQTSFSFDQEDRSYDVMSDYKIQPGDVLDVLFQIQTWKKKDVFKVQVDHAVAVNFVQTPELNQNQNVLPNGYISLPYIGQYFVVGKTPNEIQAELEDMYKDILREPDIFVTVPEFRTAIRELKADLHTAPRGLSRLVTVRPDGRVTFPMVGEISVSNQTITEVNEHLNTKYEELIDGLHVDLFLERHSGSLIYILGEVVKPGSYPIIKPITVSQAVTMAASFKPSARLDRVIVVRRHGKRMVAKMVNLKTSAVMGGRGGLFYLKPDDIVYVPKRRLAKWADVSEDIGRILMFRGWGVTLSYDLNPDKDETDNEIDLGDEEGQ